MPPPLPVSSRVDPPPLPDAARLRDDDRPNGSFLTKFISSLRPPLARSVSTPLISAAARDPGLRRSQADPGSAGQAATATIPSGRRPRPLLRRATTTGSPPSSSPQESEASSPATSTATSTTTHSPAIRSNRLSNEWDPMEAAFANPPEAGARFAPAQPAAATHALSPLALPAPTNPIPRPSPQPHALLEQPLVLVSTLLPPALLLLSQLGPSHLFSPPLVLPMLESAFGSPASTIPSLPDLAFSDTASAASQPRPLLFSPTPAYTHELHAPSTISVPAVSAAAVWRIFRGLEWVSQAGSDTEWCSDAGHDERTFDFPAVLQGVADVLAAEAAIRGVELVVGRIGFAAAPSPISTMAADEADLDKGMRPAVGESRELLVRADERAWGVALVWVLHHVLASASFGSTVEVRFRATPASPSSIPPSKLSDSQATAIPTRVTLQQWWNVSLEIIRTCPDCESTSQHASLPTPPFDSSFAASLFAYVDFSIDAGLVENGVRTWQLSTLLPAARARVVELPDEAASLLERSRASLEGIGHEPTIAELKVFAEVGLKGVKVDLRSGERSTFAKHLATYLAGWGMDVTHVALESDLVDSTPPPPPTPFSSVQGENWQQGRREALGRYEASAAGAYDSQTSDSSNPLSPDSSLPGTATSAASSHETPANFLIIDDDTATLKRLLLSYRPPPLLHYAPTLLSKRPQLAGRRTRSTTQVRQAMQHPASIIIHFASLTHYKLIKEIIQDAMATSRSPYLPEVLVIPKPAGPRRIITALWTAMKRPVIDPTLSPIATSPTSPGVQYWAPRLSPALAHQQDFDSAAASALGGKSDVAADGSSRARTPPLYFPGMPVGHPSSPLGKLSHEQASYFSNVADSMDGTSPSEGMVVQSPNGRPAIFFQPSDRVVRGAKREAEVAAATSTAPLTSPPGINSAVSAPHEIGLGQGRRVASSSSVASVESNPSAMTAGTPALTLDSFIIAAKSRAVSGTGSPESSPDVVTLQRTSSTTSLPSRPNPMRAASASVLARSTTVSSTSVPRARAISPPMSPRADAIAPASSVARTSAGIASPVRRVSGSSSIAGRPRRNTARKSPLPAVPPINVLIVEDNPINQTILSMFMKKKGIRYAVANNGEEAVEKWKAGGFHLVLMDIQLPVKDGIEATKEIREMERENNIGLITTPNSSNATSPLSPSSARTSDPSQTPGSYSPLLAMPVIIVALTASSLQIDRVNALAAGCNDFLTKPVSLPWLQQKLLEWGSMSYLSSWGRELEGRQARGVVESNLKRMQEPFRAGLAAGNAAKGDGVAGRLYIDRTPIPLPVVGTRSSENLVANSLAPGLTVSSPSPGATPTVPVEASVRQSPLVTAAPLHIAIPTPSSVNVLTETNVASLDAALETVITTSQSPTDPTPTSSPHPTRPGPSPITTIEGVYDRSESLESVVAEGARLARMGRSRSASDANDSFSRVLISSGTVSSSASPALEHAELLLAETP